VQVLLSQWLSTLSIWHIKVVNTYIHFLIVLTDSAHVGGKDTWVRDLDIHIENEEWKYVYMLPFRSSIDTNISTFSTESFRESSQLIDSYLLSKWLIMIVAHVVILPVKHLFMSLFNVVMCLMFGINCMPGWSEMV
jgi:hypothetical protein